MHNLYKMKIIDTFNQFVQYSINENYKKSSKIKSLELWGNQVESGSILPFISDEPEFISLTKPHLIWRTAESKFIKLFNRQDYCLADTGLRAWLATGQPTVEDIAYQQLATRNGDCGAHFAQLPSLQ